MEPFDDETIPNETQNTKTYRFKLAGGNLNSLPRLTAVVSGGKLTVTKPGNQNEIKDATIRSVADVKIQKEYVDVTVNTAN